jgi:thioredoxin 1
MASQSVVIATDGSFESEVLKSNVPVMVDFWAEWCGPCRVLGPTVDELATEFQGKAKICKMNVDENPNTPGQYQIRGIPTLLFFKSGKLVDQIVGVQSKDAIASVLKRHM